MRNRLRINKQLRQIKKINRIKRKTLELAIIGIGKNIVLCHVVGDVGLVENLNRNHRPEAERMHNLITLTAPKIEPLREIFIEPEREIDRKHRYNHAKFKRR